MVSSLIYRRKARSRSFRAKHRVIIESLEGPDGSTFNVPYVPPDFGLKAAIYSGLQSMQVRNSTTFQQVLCSTGNCTWPAFASFAVCSQCFDVSNHLTTTMTNNTTVSPDVLQYPDHGQGATFDLPPYTSYTLHPSGVDIQNANGIFDGNDLLLKARSIIDPTASLSFRQEQSLLAAFVILQPDKSYYYGQTPWEETPITALECGLTLCLKSYSLTVQNGNIDQIVLAETSKKVPDSWWSTEGRPANIKNQTALETLDWNPIFNGDWVSRNDYQLDSSDLNIPNDGDNTTFNATQSFLDTLAGELRSMFDTGSTLDPAAYVRSGNRSANTAFLPDTMEGLFKSFNISKTFGDIADSLTAYLHLNNVDLKQGNTQEWITRFSVRWAFLVVPLLVHCGERSA